MFREMRRQNQAMAQEQNIAVLEKGKTGVLAVNGDGGYPYAVPLNYAYADNRIYFHCAREGHKLDAIRSCGKVSFCVIDADEVVKDTLSTDYRSVIVFGCAREIESREEKIGILRLIGEKYDVNRTNLEKELAEDGLPAVVAIEIEHISGKQAKSLAGK